MIRFGMPIRRLFSISLLGTVLVLAGCGFHLRGEAQLPTAMSYTAIEGLGEYDPLRIALRRALHDNGVQVVSVGANPTATLTIVENRRERQIIPVDVTNKAQQYELVYIVVFKVKGKDIDVPEQRIRLTREYLFNPTNVLGRSDQERILYNDMQRDAVQLILYRLQAETKAG
jgi:LPS-assembly lipoprotein